MVVAMVGQNPTKTFDRLKLNPLLQVDSYNGNTIHVKMLATGFKNYIDVTLANDYGSASKFMFVNPYENVSAKQVGVSGIGLPKIMLSVNGEQKKTCILKDGDSLNIALDLENSNLQIDSVCWRLGMQNYYKKTIWRTLSKERNVELKVSPELFDCCFLKDKSNKGDAYMREFNGKTIIDPDNCYIVCKIWCSHNGQQNKTYYVSEKIQLDVLPQEPVVELVEAWEVTDSSGKYPRATVKITTDNCEECLLYVFQNYPGLPQYMDTAFCKLKEVVYTLDLGEWNDAVYCIASNQYGRFVGDWEEIVPTGLSPTSIDDVYVNVNNSELNIKSIQNLNVTVYSMDGKVVSCVTNVQEYSVRLAPGLYILRISDKYNNKITRKIQVR